MDLIVEKALNIVQHSLKSMSAFDFILQLVNVQLLKNSWNSWKVLSWQLLKVQILFIYHADIDYEIFKIFHF